MKLETKFNIGDAVIFKRHKTVHYVRRIIVSDKGVEYELQAKNGYVEFYVGENYLDKAK